MNEPTSAGQDVAPAISVEPPLRKLWRLARPDVIGIVVIAVAMILLRRRALQHGMCFNDPTWYFHFGNRTLHGAVPYRDYIFQVGPLPIYVDALAQKLFGETYIASQYAGLFVVILRVSVMWLLARRLVGTLAGAGVAIFCAVDPVFAFSHHWSTPYAQLFVVLSGLFFLLASRADGRRALVYLGLAGMSAGLIVSARQASASTIGIAIVIASAVMLARKEFFTPRRSAALWIGFAAGIAVVFVVLAALGALGPAIQQLFLDAPQKKSVHGLRSFFDAISGGALVVGGSYTWLHGLLEFLGIPIVIVAGMAYLASQERPVPAATVAMLVMPIALVIGLVTRDAQLNYLSDLPRTLLSLITLTTLLSPRLLERWFGLSPVIALGLGIVPLASDAALELSLPGRGWGDSTSLVTGVILVTLASTKLSGRLKQGVCGTLALAGLIHLGVAWHYRQNPFASPLASEGRPRDNNVSSPNPRLEGVRISQARRTALAWLNQQVTPGSSCFVYGNLPVLYTLLACHNPTRIDTTAADFLTGKDAEAAIAELRAHPPDFIVAQEKQWMNPPLTQDLPADPVAYGGLNAMTSMVLHQGLRSMLDQYDVIGYLGDVLGPPLVAVSSVQFDIIDATRVYRRKR
jgi:hypothetical protein